MKDIANNLDGHRMSLVKRKQMSLLKIQMSLLKMQLSLWSLQLSLWSRLLLVLCLAW